MTNTITSCLSKIGAKQMSANKYKQTICFNNLFLAKMTDSFTHHILLNQYIHAIMR